MDGRKDAPKFVLRTQLYKRLCPSVGPPVGPSVRWSVVIESKGGKPRISASAHPSATGGRVTIAQEKTEQLVLLVFAELGDETLKNS